jgi:hypothetical protein
MDEQDIKIFRLLEARWKNEEPHSPSEEYLFRLVNALILHGRDKTRELLSQAKEETTV